MKRRRFLSAVGGGAFIGPTVAAGRRTPPPGAEAPSEHYDGPMISAHEHLLFLPDGDISWLVEWMDANDWKRILAFSTPDQIGLYEEYPSRFMPFNQEPFSRYLLPKVLAGVDMDDVELPPHLPNPDDPPELDELPSLFEANLEAHSEWQGIGELGLHLLHRVEGDTDVSRPDADWLMELYGVAADHDATVMLHPPRLEPFGGYSAETPLDNQIVQGLHRAFDEFPKTQFLVHGFRKDELDAVGPLLENHDNWVYDVSGVMFGHSEFWTSPTLPEDEWDDKRDWVDQHFDDQHIEAHVEDAFDRWGEILTEHPDRVVWGIDTGRPWHYYEGYFDVHDRLYRGLLGRLPNSDAQKIAHVNARRYL